MVGGLEMLELDSLMYGRFLGRQGIQKRDPIFNYPLYRYPRKGRISHFHLGGDVTLQAS